ncbi:type II secretion system F family protein [Streptomyces monticola]|uniref:Type II secretion system F family protein n=1 Tax=Streptomyces monticola TaxID=2666263 RepID=A0ABW2JSN6_9ACTN
MTGALWWSVCGVLVAAGLVAVVIATVGTTRPPGHGRLAQWRAQAFGGPAAGRRAARRRSLLIASGVVTVATWLLTGVFVVSVLVGLAVIGVPWLLAPTASSKLRIAKLEGLAEWSQRLAEVIRLGFALEAALSTSRKNAPAALAEEVGELADKLQANWPAAEALYDFADRLDDITADKVTAALALAAMDPGPRLADALEDLSASVREEVASRRRIEAGREKARTAVRVMTFISIGLIPAGFLVPHYTAPYATLFGQLFLALVTSAFVAVLVWARRLSNRRPPARFLVHDPRSTVTPPAAREQEEVAAT